MLRKKKAPTSLEDVFGNEDPPLDAWGNEFRLVTPGPGDLKFDLVSLGADGSEGGAGENEDLKWSENK
jgi:type II secretory pathway pseudopilin PulG